MSVIANSTNNELSEIFAEAVQRAQERNRRMGIRNVYSRGGRVYRERLKTKTHTKKSNSHSRN